MEDYSELYENNMQNLKHAINCCDEVLSHDDLIKELLSSDDIKKQLCIIEIKEIKSQNEADLLVYNLTGKSGPVREAASFKILELIKDNNFRPYFQTKDIINTIVKGITDINPSVSRNMVDTVQFINDCEFLINQIICEIKQTLDSIEDIKQNRSYKTNKKNFNLYWNLEALTNLSDKINIDNNIVEIIRIVSNSNDYTIREKASKFICAVKNPVFNEIAEILKNDENIYVRKHFDCYDII